MFVVSVCVLLAWPGWSQDASEASPAAAPKSTVPLTADETFVTRVKGLQEQVSDLKEKILRTKARLLLLQETVLGGDMLTGARAVLVHKNEMGSSFVLESVSYALDGAPVYTAADTNGELEKRDEFEVFTGRIVPGLHQIAVRMVFRGNGYGLFSYLDGYKFKVQSNYTFNAEAGKVTTVKVVGYEKGGLTTEMKDKPAVRYDISVERDKASNSNASPPAASVN